MVRSGARRGLRAASDDRARRHRREQLDEVAAPSATPSTDGRVGRPRHRAGTGRGAGGVGRPGVAGVADEPHHLAHGHRGTVGEALGDARQVGEVPVGAVGLHHPDRQSAEGVAADAGDAVGRGGEPACRRRRTCRGRGGSGTSSRSTAGSASRRPTGRDRGPGSARTRRASPRPAARPAPRGQRRLRPARLSFGGVRTMASIAAWASGGTAPPPAVGEHRRRRRRRRRPGSAVGSVAAGGGVVGTAAGPSSESARAAGWAPSHPGGRIWATAEAAPANQSPDHHGGGDPRRWANSSWVPEEIRRPGRPVPLGAQPGEAPTSDSTG